MKIKNLVELFSILPEDERIITDVLRQIIIETCLNTAKKKYLIMFRFFMATKAYVLSGLLLFPEVVLNQEFC